MNICRRHALRDIIGLAMIPRFSYVRQSLWSGWPDEWNDLPHYDTRFIGALPGNTAREYRQSHGWNHEPTVAESQEAQRRLRKAMITELHGRLIGWRIWPEWTFARYDNTWTLTLRSRYFVDPQVKQR